MHLRSYSSGGNFQLELEPAELVF